MSSNAKGRAVFQEKLDNIFAGLEDRQSAGLLREVFFEKSGLLLLHDGVHDSNIRYLEGNAVSSKRYFEAFAIVRSAVNVIILSDEYKQHKRRVLSGREAILSNPTT